MEQTARLITVGNLALFEYPSGASKPEFTLGIDGVLFVFGYSMQFVGKPIRVAKRFETKLGGYTAIGTYSYAKTRIEGDSIDDVIEKQNIDKENCLVMIKGGIEPE